MPRKGPVGLVLTPGASARRDQSGLVAIDEAVTNVGLTVERVDFPGPAAGKRRPDSPAVCIDTIRTATSELAERLAVPTRRVAIGGRSMGGRMCSMALCRGPQGRRPRSRQLPAPPSRTARATPHRPLPGARPAVPVRVGSARRLRGSRRVGTGNRGHPRGRHPRLRGR
jgi:dienelactone hydrolase